MQDFVQKIRLGWGFNLIYVAPTSLGGNINNFFYNGNFFKIFFTSGYFVLISDVQYSQRNK